MAGEYLPPVITRLTADIDDFVAKIEQAKALVAGLDDVGIKITADVDLNSFARAKAKVDAMAASTGGTIRLQFAISQRSLLAALTAARAIVRANPITVPLYFVVNKTSLAASLAAAKAVSAVTGAVGKNTAAVGRNNLAWTRWGRLTATAIHWIISGTAELAAILIPATVAFGAWAAVWLQGTTNVAEHINSVYTATEAMANMGAETAGQMMGLGHALQTAQNEANPDVYQALGGAINIVREHFSDLAQTGLQVGKVFDGFVAHLVYDLSAAGGAGGRMNDLLSNMVSDLTRVGQVFGNLGHALLNFASDMPGLAEVLLGVVDAISRLILWLSSLPGHIFTVIMAIEEFMRWGGLLVNILGKIGIEVEDLGPKFLSLQRFQGVFMSLLLAIPRAVQGVSFGLALLIEKMGFLGRAGTSASEGLANFAAGIDGVAGKITFFQGVLIAAAVVGLGALIWAIHRSQSAAQQLVTTLVDSVGKASNVQAFQVIAQNYDTLSQKANQAAQAANHLAAQNQVVADSAVRGGNQLNAARQDLDAYKSGLQQTNQQANNFAQGAAAIMKTYGVSFGQALAIATGANVKLSGSFVRLGKNASQAGFQIEDFMAGMKAMSAPASAIGNDMQAVAIQTGLTATKVAQLNQAWDQLMQNLTGGTGAFADVEGALQTMQSDIKAKSIGITGSISSISQAGTNMKYTLQGITSASMQSWQQFDQALGSSGEQLADWFRTAGAEGVMSSGQFTTAMRAMVAQFLPFTQGNKTALAELRGFADEAGLKVPGSLKAAEAAFGSSGKGAKILQGIINQVTQQMSNMSQVAQNLGDVLNSQVTSALAGDIIKQSGLNQAIQKYATDLDNLGPKNRATITALHQLQNEYNTVMTKADAAARATAHLGQSSRVAAGQMNMAARYANALAEAINAIPNEKTINIQIASSQSLHAIASAGAVPHAAGALNAAPGLALVGEQGPELVSLHGGESISNASRTSDMLGHGAGGDVIIQVNGRELFRFMKEQVFNTNVNNNTRAGTGSVQGRLAPR